MAASLPIPIRATPRSNFIFLEEHQYLTFESRLVPGRVMGLPLRKLQSGQSAAFVDPEVPVIAANIAPPPIMFSDRPGLFVRVVPYTATLGADGTSILIAPDAEQTHRHGHYVVPRASLVDLPPPTADKTPADIITPLRGFTIETSDKYMTKEDRTVKVSWRPSTAGVITREKVYQLFSSHDMVESIIKCGELEARVTFRSPYAVSSVLCGVERVPYEFWHGRSGRPDEILVESDIGRLQDTPDRDSRLYITFDAQLNYAELHNFFNRYGAVNHVFLDANVGQPRRGVVLFQNPESVINTMRGAQVLTLYLGEQEIRVRPYPAA